MSDIADLGFKVDTGGLKKGERALGDLEKQGAKTSKGMGAYSRTIKVGFVAIAATMVGALASYKEFGKSVAEINTLLDDSWDASALDEMAAGARELSKAYGGSSTEQAKALYQVVSAGASTAAEALDTLTVANKLAIAGVTDVTTAITAIAPAMNVYADSNLTATQAAESMLIAVKNGITTIPELSSALGKVAPIAKTAGLSFDEMNASIAAITAGGLSTAESVTGLKAALLGMTAPGKDAADLAFELGINMSEADIKSRGFATVMAEIRDKTGGSVEQLKKLLGSAEAVGSVLALTDNNMAKFGSTMDDMSGKSGSLDAAFGKMTDGTAKLGFEWGRLKAKAADAFLGLGEQAAPAVADLLAAINSIDFSVIASNIAGVVTAIVSGAQGIYTGVMLWIDKFKTDPNAAAQEMSTSMSATFGAMVGTLVNYFGDAYSGISGWLTKIKESPDGTLSAMVESISGFMGDMITAFIDGFSEVAPEAAKALKELPGTIKQLGVDVVNGLIEGMKSGISNVGKAAKEVAESAYDSVKSFFRIQSPSKLMSVVGVDVSEGLAVGILSGGVKAVTSANAVSSNVSASFGVLKTDIITISNDINDSVQTVGDSLSVSGGLAIDYGEDIKTGVVDSMADAIISGGSFADSMAALWKRMAADWAKAGLTKLIASLFGGGGVDLSGFSVGGSSNVGGAASAYKGLSAAVSAYTAKQAGANIVIQNGTEVIASYQVATTGTTAAMSEAAVTAGEFSAASTGTTAAMSEAAVTAGEFSTASSGATTAMSGMSAAMIGGGIVAVGFAINAAAAAARQRHMKEATDDVNEAFRTSTDVTNTLSAAYTTFGADKMAVQLSDAEVNAGHLSYALEQVAGKFQEGYEGTVLLEGGTDDMKLIMDAYTADAAAGIDTLIAKEKLLHPEIKETADKVGTVGDAATKVRDDWIKSVGGLSTSFSEAGNDLEEFIGGGADAAQARIDAMHGVDFTTTHTIVTVGSNRDPNDSKAAGTHGGWVSVPAGFPNDSFTLGLQSGEEYMVKSAGEVRSGGGDNAMSAKIIMAIEKAGEAQIAAINRNTLNRGQIANNQYTQARMRDLSNA